MSIFKLDPPSILERVRASGVAPHIPTLGQSLARGVIGFTLVSVAGFLPWVLAGKWMYANPSEGIMYGTCAAVFVVLSGLLLHPLIIGPESLKRFYIFFSAAFLMYAAAWTAGWMGLRGQHMHVRSAVGLFAGTAVMGIMFGVAFDAKQAIPKVVAALFVLNALGYFIGGEIEGAMAHAKQLDLGVATLSGPALDASMKIAWGVCYGIGFGAGLGYSFYTCQSEVRRVLNARASGAA